MTEQQIKTAKIVLIVLVILGALSFVFVRWVKPGIDKKRDARLAKANQVVKSAQAPTPVNPAKNIANNPDPVITTPGGKSIIGLGGATVMLGE